MNDNELRDLIEKRKSIEEKILNIMNFPNGKVRVMTPNGMYYAYVTWQVIFLNNDSFTVVPRTSYRAKKDGSESNSVCKIHFDEGEYVLPMDVDDTIIRGGMDTYHGLSTYINR